MDIASTAIGALLGFIFALWLGKIQQRGLAKERAAVEKAANASTLKLTVHSCGANVETLANFKGQYAIAVAADAAVLDPLMQAQDTEGAVAAMPTLAHFYQGLSRLDFIRFPSDAQYAFAVDDVPLMTLLVHRASTTANAVNDRIDSRNALIGEQARANGRGMSEQEVVYFTMMLISEARNILDLVNQALFFHQLLHDQVHNYGKHRFADGQFRKFELLGEKKELMPAADFLPGYREQMVDFSER